MKNILDLEGLSIDYDSIFYADLDANKIKAYCVSDRIKDQSPQEYQASTFDGFDAQYIKEWVHPDDRESMVKATRPEYIRTRLREDMAFYINYRICRNTKLAYMQLHMVDVSEDARGSQVVLGYRNIDKEVEKGLSQKQLLQLLNDVLEISKIESEQVHIAGGRQ